MEPRSDRLHVIVNITVGSTHRVLGRTPLDLAEAAVDAGAGVVQIRAKGGTDRERYSASAPIVELCNAEDVTTIIDDRADIALALGAAGVHGGDDDLGVRAMRVVVGHDRIVGATARDPVSARRAQHDGADYIGIGPVYESKTKPGFHEPIGLAGLASVAEAVSVPVIAIGGITMASIEAVIAAGAYGVAVSEAISNSESPFVEVQELLTALDSA